MNRSKDLYTESPLQDAVAEGKYDQIAQYLQGRFCIQIFGTVHV